jgi:tetratricopeptide (TPR) repeat protein
MMERPPASGEGPTLMMERPPELAPAPKATPPKPQAAAAAPNKFGAQEETTTKPPATKAPTSAPTSMPLSAPVSSSLLRDDPHSDGRMSGPAPRRPAAGRWIVGVVLLGMAALAAVTVGKKYLPGSTPEQPQEDARLGILLEQGDRDLKDGDLDTANESYVKASALSEKDTRVAVRLARLAAVRADVAWLKVRLLPEADADLLNAKRELEIAVGRAKQAAEKAHSLSPDDADVTRCRIDAMRLAGDLEGARKLVATLPKGNLHTSDELLFAALDLAEPSPGWATVIERLRNAARDEQNLGRARTMLIYALARSGDGAGAGAELDRLAALPRPHPLAPALRAFVASHAEAEPKKPAEDAGAAGGDDGLKAATEAIEKGELERADGLLKELAAKTPNDVKVLTAQAGLALKKRDRAGAIHLYEKAIATDKTYLPAIAALADIKWENGERQTASTLYRQIIERGGEASPYTRRAKERLSIFADSWGDFGQGSP